MSKEFTSLGVGAACFSFCGGGRLKSILDALYNDIYQSSFSIGLLFGKLIIKSCTNEIFTLKHRCRFHRIHRYFPTLPGFLADTNPIPGCAHQQSKAKQ